MNKADVEFTVGLNTSPAERQLDYLEKRMKASSHIYSDVFRDMGPGGFKMVGQPYQNSNNYGVPSTQVLERSLSVFTNTMEKFARVIDSMSARMVNFTTVGNPYTSTPRTIYASSNQPKIAGYLPYNPSVGYTMNYETQRPPVNDPNKVFDYLIQKRKMEQGENPYMGVYDRFNNLHSSQGASGMYDIWKGLFGKRGLLALPAPPQKSENNQPPNNEPPEEQGKDIVEQSKRDNDELKDKLMLWGKIAATIYSIRKVLQGLAKVWKFGAETVTGVNSNLNEEAGFFSTDPEGALRANSDKTRAMLYAGIRNMGANAPVSKSGMDYATTKITEMWTAAMSGRNVDARTTIDAQRLKDFFGIDLTVAGLLTGEREGKTATDIQLDIMEKVEKNISKLAEADEVTKGQVTDSLKNILGEELIDAIVANANKNLRIENPELRVTLGDLLMQHGGSAIPAGNLTESTADAVESLSELNEAIQKLKNTLVQEFGPVFATLTDAISGVVNWINRKINRVSGTKDALGEVLFKTSVASLTNDYIGYEWFKQKKENGKKESADVFQNQTERVLKDLQSSNVYDVLESLYLSQPEALNATSIENLGIKATQSVLGNALIKGKLDPNSKNPVERALAEHKYTVNGITWEGYDAIKWEALTNPNSGIAVSEVQKFFTRKDEMSDDELIRAYQYILKNFGPAEQAFQNAFNKGGALDYGTEMNVAEYLFNPAFYSSAEEFFNFLSELKKQSPEVMDNTVEINPTWSDKNKNNRIDFGEVGVTLVVKDQYGNRISTENLQAQLQ